MDPAYGVDARLRTAMTALGLIYVAGIQSNTLVWAPGTGQEEARSPKRGRQFEPQVMSAKDVAQSLPAKAWRKIGWREGSAERLASRFARVRVRVAHRHGDLTEGRAEEWLLIEWPKGEAAPSKYWLSTLPADVSFRRLVDRAKLRWRIERDYLELKQEVGLDHFEGRGWRGFHHHATLCIAAYGFLISERETIPPSGSRSTGVFPQLAVSQGYRPRGSSAAVSKTRPKLDRDNAPTPRCRAG
jgi:SRSO17 transposase